MQALKEKKKTNRRQLARVHDEEKVTYEANVILKWGSEQKSEYTKEDDDDETIEYVDTDEKEEKKDDDDNKSIEFEQTNDEETDDEFVHVLTPILETPLAAPVTTLLPPPSLSTISPVILQTTTPIPTPQITTEAPILTNAVLEFDARTTVQLRVAKLEKDMSELKKIDHSTKAIASLKSKVPRVIDNYLGSKISDALQKEL
nr:hypothetical protein [Tanacetum cinerariifolium]